MFGNLGELAKMMSKAKDIQANLKKFKEEMPTMEFSASSPGCQVRVTVTGDFRIKEISLTDEALKEGASGGTDSGGGQFGAGGSKGHGAGEDERSHRRPRRRHAGYFLRIRHG